jgi:hypothetical protein
MEFASKRAMIQRKMRDAAQRRAPSRILGLSVIASAATKQ